MDLSFGDICKNDNDISVRIHRGDGKPMFKQFNNVKIDSVSDEAIVLNLQDRDISSYDDDLIGAAKENRKAWFGREVADKTIEKSYQSPVEDGIFTTTRHEKLRCFDHEKNQVDADSLTEGMRCDVVVELSSLWFIKRNFGPDWLSVQIKLHAPPATDPYDDYLFQDEE